MIEQAEFSLSNEDKEVRKERAEDLVSFLEKIKSKIDWTNAEYFISQIENISEDEYKSVLTRLNGIIRDIPIEKREFNPKQGGARRVHNEERKITSLYFPKPEDRDMLFHVFFKKLQETVVLGKQDLEINKRIPLAVFNSILQIHPFRDGNGRTARLAYFLLSPKIDKGDEELAEKIKSLLVDRPAEIPRYNRAFNFFVYSFMLEKRGLAFDDMKEAKNYAFKYRIESNDKGFEPEYIRFFAAYDSMNEEERIKYNRGTQTYELVYKFEEFDNDLKQRYLDKLNDTRNEFAETAIAASLDERSEPIIEPLEKILLAEIV